MSTEDAFDYLMAKALQGNNPKLLIKMKYAKGTVTSYRSRRRNNKTISSKVMKGTLKRVGAIGVEVPMDWTFPDDLFL